MDDLVGAKHCVEHEEYIVDKETESNHCIVRDGNRE